MRGAVPLATTAKVAAWPTFTVWLDGCVVIEGAVGGPCVVGVYVQVRISWVAVKPPVPPVNPT
jgi:hypothetical protein